MGKVAKPILMTFRGGPLHRIQANMTWLPQVQVFVDDRDNAVMAYLRDETVYRYDPALSVKLSANHEAVVAFFKPNKMDVQGEED